MTRKMSKEEKQVTKLVRRRMKESKSSELLGFDVESVHDGRAIFRLDVRPRHKQIHGGIGGYSGGDCGVYRDSPRSGARDAGVEDQLSGTCAGRTRQGRGASSAKGAEFHCDRMRDSQRRRLNGGESVVNVFGGARELNGMSNSRTWQAMSAIPRRGGEAPRSRRDDPTRP